MIQADPFPEPFDTFMLDVGDGHQIYVEQSGNPIGEPLINFHGGPGSRSKPRHRINFDLKKFRIILFDQRNCGRSTPWAVDNRNSLASNSPENISNDVERIRIKLGIPRWHVAGGSWGSSLALLYAIQNPLVIKSLTLKSLFLAQLDDWAWMPQAAKVVSPLAYMNLQSLFPESTGAHLLQQVAARILSTESQADAKQYIEALQSTEHGLELLSDRHSNPYAREERSPQEMYNVGILYSHMIQNHAFQAGWAFNSSAISALSNLDVCIVHGQCDLICPLENVLKLSKLCAAKVCIAENAGHSVDLDGNLEWLMGQALNRLN